MTVNLNGIKRSLINKVDCGVSIMNNNVFRSEEDRVLMELKDSLKGLFGNRIVGLILFGSRARGDFDSDSDIDIVISNHCPGHNKGT